MPALVFCVLSYALYAVNAPPPLPPAPKRPHKSAAVHQGDGAAKLLVKPMVAVGPTTNTITWRYDVNPSNYWWNIESSTDLKNWSVLISNASGVEAVNLKKSEALRAYRLSARVSP